MTIQGPSGKDALAAFRRAKVEDGDGKWDAGEVAGLANLARGTGDQFSKEGVTFMVSELNSATPFEPEARKKLFDVLVYEAKVDTKKLTAEPPPVVLAVQDGKSNKFYAMRIEGSSVVTQWGKIGTAGQTETQDFGSGNSARDHFMDTLRSKLKKGYKPAEAESVLPKAAASESGGAGAIQTVADFRKLSESQQLEILEWGKSAQEAGLSSSGELAIGALKGTAKAFAEKMRAAASDATGDFEIHDDEYLHVGSPEIKVEVFTTKDGDVAGGTIHVFQRGCERPEDYWDNEDKYTDKKLRELADATDVSWSCSGIYAAGASGLVHLRDPDYMEWSGY